MHWLCICLPARGSERGYSYLSQAWKIFKDFREMGPEVKNQFAHRQKMGSSLLVGIHSHKTKLFLLSPRANPLVPQESADVLIPAISQGFNPKLVPPALYLH